MATSDFSPKFELESRTLVFAMDTKSFVKKLPRTISNIEFSKQLIRSSSSVGANYIEANESLGAKDFVMHLRISCKEAKESIYWLRLVDHNNFIEQERLIGECGQLIKIFGSMLRGSRA